MYVCRSVLCSCVMAYRLWSSYCHGGKSKKVVPKQITFMLLFESHVK